MRLDTCFAFGSGWASAELRREEVGDDARDDVRRAAPDILLNARETLRTQRRAALLPGEQLADEAGSSPVHRGALQDSQSAETAVTRCFSGRYARGLRNRFIEDHDGAAPFGYPEIHHMTSPLRAAAVRAGDPHGTNVWAGTGFKKARAASVADIISDLA